jgi:LemA protein
MTPSLMASAFVLALIGSVLIVFSRFNTLVRSRKRAQEAWAGIDVQLRQRASLIPNLVEAIRGYAEHEREVFEESRARVAHCSRPAPPVRRAPRTTC